MLHTSPYFSYSDCGALTVGLSVDIGASVSFGITVAVGICDGDGVGVVDSVAIGCVADGDVYKRQLYAYSFS